MTWPQIRTSKPIKANTRVTFHRVRARLAQEGLRPETIRWVVSGERLVAASATAANGLGPPAALVVGR